MSYLRKNEVNMYKALIISDKLIFRKKDEEYLDKKNIQVTVSIRCNEDLFKTFYKNFDLVVLNDYIHSIDIDNACHTFRSSTQEKVLPLLLRLLSRQCQS